MSKTKNQTGLLIALLIIILLPLPITLFPGRLRLIVTLAYSLLILSGIQAATKNKKDFILISVLGGLGFLSIWASYVLEQSSLAQWLKIISLLGFYSFLALLLFQKIAKNKIVDLSIIFASISGYLLIGMVGGLIFEGLNSAIPNSFNGLSANSNLFDLQYFSFITLTSVGYGDISPASEAARSLVLVFALAGQLYLTILIAILVGKYLSQGGRRET